MVDITIVIIINISLMGYINQLITGGHHPDGYIYIYIMGYSGYISISVGLPSAKLNNYGTSPLSQTLNINELNHPYFP